jgi:serine/threonine protein kinase
MNGRLDEFIGTPVYLPPESTPTVSGEEVEAHYSVKTDVYALTLTFYELLTGARAYAHRGLYQLKGQDLLLELIGHKHAHVDPIDPASLQEVPGFNARAVEETLDILRAGLHPDPEQRAPTQTLLNQARKTYQVVERRKKEVGEYRFDAVKGLRLWQDRFPRISPERNPYLL